MERWDYSACTYLRSCSCGNNNWLLRITNYLSSSASVEWAALRSFAGTALVMSATIKDTARLLGRKVKSSPASTRALSLLWVTIVLACASTHAFASASSSHSTLGDIHS